MILPCSKPTALLTAKCCKPAGCQSLLAGSCSDRPDCAHRSLCVVDWCIGTQNVFSRPVRFDHQQSQLVTGSDTLSGSLRHRLPPAIEISPSRAVTSKPSRLFGLMSAGPESDSWSFPFCLSLTLSRSPPRCIAHFMVMLTRLVAPRPKENILPHDCPPICKTVSEGQHPYCALCLVL